MLFPVLIHTEIEADGYIKGYKEFKGDLNKSILLSGAIGTGKTLMILSVINIIEAGSNKIITKMHAKKMDKMIKSQEKGYYDQRPLFIDDLGREPKEANTYGNKSEPLIDLISVRYDLGAWTFATTNFKDETLTSFYGAAIVDRFNEMFNKLVILFWTIKIAPISLIKGVITWQQEKKYYQSIS